MYLLSDYDYDLPEQQIAQVPCQDRSGSRLLHINRKENLLNHCRFFDLANLLVPGDLLVVNNTRVIPARLLGKKETGGRVEVMIIDYAAGVKHLESTGFFQCGCLIKASKSPRVGAILHLGEGIKAEVMQVQQYISQVRFFGGQDFITALKAFGQIPLPP